MEVKELQQIFTLIVNKLQFEGYTLLEVDDDLYRYIPTDKWDSFNEIVIENGSLYDDVESLKELANDPDKPCTYVDFDRLASFLRYISQKHNPV
jgi:hypothetical protein